MHKHTFKSPITDGLLKSLTPPSFLLIYRPRTTGRGGSVGFLTRKELPTKIVDAPTYSTFENIGISASTISKSYVFVCVYRTPGSCSLAFLDDLLFFFVDSYHLLLLAFTICGDFNVHVDTDCIDQRKFLDLLDSSNLIQSVNKPTYLHGHILDLILSPSDSNFISNVTVGDLVLDHVLVKCRLNFACPALAVFHTIRSTCRNFVIILQISPLSCLLLALPLIYMITMYMTLVVCWADMHH